MGGKPHMVPVGSPAIRRAIERYQPRLGLHGHIHESRGSQKLGKTICLNPGSEYGEGVLIISWATNGSVVRSKPAPTSPTPFGIRWPRIKRLVLF